MTSDITPSIHSFIIRFVVDDVPSEVGKQTVYHGAIRHIQNAEELSFHEWSEALEFMSRYVPFEQWNDKSNPLEKKP
jgi:hypothetical protein